MIIGNGFIANAFKELNFNHSNLVIFASGVSNSLSKNNSVAFTREENLIKEYVGTDKKFIYFSTSSVFDLSRSDTGYIIFKKKIESFIKDNFENFIIFRLPIIAGISNNPHTLLNFISNSIDRSKKMKIESNSSRYIVDITDVVNIVSTTHEQFNKEIVNLNFDNKIKILDLINIFETIKQKKAIIDVSDGGDSYDIDNSKLIDCLNKIELNNYQINTKKILEKYYSN